MNVKTLCLFSKEEETKEKVPGSRASGSSNFFNLNNPIFD
jgi:hypothetical protein